MRKSLDFLHLNPKSQGPLMGQWRHLDRARRWLPVFPR